MTDSMSASDYVAGQRKHRGSKYRNQRVRIDGRKGRNHGKIEATERKVPPAVVEHSEGVAQEASAPMRDECTPFPLTDQQLDRFWAKVSKGDSCWDWTAHRSHFGHGRIRIAGRDFMAHRVSWAVHYGPIPDGLWVLHHCDNPPCVNPEHLYLGTPQDNSADMVARDRQMKGDRHHFRLHPECRPVGLRNGHATHPESYEGIKGDHHWTRRHPENIVSRKGEAHPCARLTGEQVREMRRIYADGDLSLAEVGSRFGVSFQHVSDIVNRKRWKHV